MKIYKKLFQFVLFVNTILLFIFIMENINNLDAIEFDIVVSGETFSFSLNLYQTLLIIGILFIVIILASINVFGLGLNTEGTKAIAKYLSLTGIIAVLTIASAYYLLQIGLLGLIFQLFMLVIYVLYAFTGLTESSSDTD